MVRTIDQCANVEEGDLLFSVKSWTFSIEIFIHHERISRISTTTLGVRRCCCEKRLSIAEWRSRSDHQIGQGLNQRGRAIALDCWCG
jgi:hypothetical protein